MSSPISTERACPACGTAVLPGDRFCPLCGKALTGTTGTGLTPQPSPWDAVLRRLQAATLGEFEIKRELGRGGMAAVYLAHDIALDLKVAIKVMAPGLMMGEGMTDRFRLEAVTVAKLSHPNIVRVHALRQAAEDLHFIVMQYIPGRTIERIVRETGPMPIPVVRVVLAQVGRALAYAHRRGVVHRDIKPGNIMLDATGDAVVTDFGIAKVATAPSHTLTGSVVGTPAYMSPEQCFAQPLTGASDQYSLGIVAFEMLTGQVPFSGPSYTVMHGHTHGEIPSVRALRPDCPPDLEAMITRLLAKTPDERFPSIAEAAAAAGAPELGEHDPLREELVRLAAVEESAVLDAMYPTPRSPVPQTRASVPRVTTPGPRTPTPPSAAALTPATSTPEPAPPPQPGAAPPPTAAMRTVVDPALLATPRPGVVPPVSTTPTPARGVSRRALIGAALAVVVTVGGALLVIRPWADSGPVVTDPTEPPPPEPPPGPPPQPDPRPPATLRITSVPPIVTVGDTFTLSAIFRGPDSLARIPNEWRSRAPALVRIDAGGRAQALRDGPVVLILRRGTLADSVAFSVRPGAPQPVATRLVIAPPAQAIRVPDRVRLRVEEVDATGTRSQPSTRVTWRSTNPGVASIDPASGELVARAGGRTVVSAHTATARATLAIAVEAAPAPDPEPPRPPPDPVVTPPPRPQPDPDRPPPGKPAAELRAELDDVVRSYGRAIEAEDLGRMRALYPSITADQLNNFRGFFDGVRDIKLTIDRIDPLSPLTSVTGSVARVRVEYRIEYYNASLRRTARETARWDATVERTANGWRMQSVR